ncbi:unnamed protein product [Hymenolepis diminuta]|uniref:Reverse transcriptase domain-containing protein n=1 Tax=Hymenolepis diminuta TaxID=6216 RepID=A0A3P7AAD6_HYMDI|nr:unnamed protein product [Hymenolepis diminuta]
MSLLPRLAFNYVLSRTIGVNGAKRLDLKEALAHRFLPAPSNPSSLAAALPMMEEEIKCLEQRGLLKPPSLSKWAPPIVVIRRANATT